MTIRKKIYAVLVVMVLALAAQSSFMVLQTNRIHDASVDIGKIYEPIVIKTYQLKIAVVQVQQWLTDISATRGLDGLDDGFDMAQQNFDLGNSLLAELAALDTENAARYRAIVPVFADYYAAGRAMGQAYVDQGPAAGNVIMGSFDTTAEAINKQVDAVMASVRERSERNLEGQLEHTQMLKSTVLVLAVLFFIAMLLMALAVFKVLLAPIEAMAEMAKDLAQGEGDLTKRLDESRRDELGITAGWINRFVERTHGTIQTISQVTTELDSAADHLSNSSKQASEGMAAQLLETEQAARAMSEMLTAAHEVAQNATTTAAQTETVHSQSQQGRQISDDTSDQINSLVAEMDKAHKAIDQLGEDSANIVTVLDVIKSISEQTNLLALNAAIEAARAGEQGRGFAVVADEVRTLAGRSQQSAEEIQEMVAKLQSSMSEATRVIRSGSEEAHKSGESVERVKHALEQIDDSVSGINQMNTQIAAAAEEQSHISNDIDTNISNISQVTRTNSDNVSAVHQTSEDLKTSVDKLNQLVSGFKI